jgi:hypothetical protein
MMPRPIDPSRDRLFGLLALQNGLINQAQLVTAFQAWTLDKSRSLADQLVARGDLDADACAGLEPPLSPTQTLRKGGKGIARSRQSPIARNQNTHLETVPPARSTPSFHHLLFARRGNLSRGYMGRYQWCGESVAESRLRGDAGLQVHFVAASYRNRRGANSFK